MKTITGQNIPATGVYFINPFEDISEYLNKNNYPAQKYVYINGYLYSLTKVAAPNSTFISFK